MYRSIVRLDKNLREFTKAVSKVGCSPALRQDVDDFGDLLRHLLHLFRKNASKLFGDDQDPTTNVVEHEDSPILWEGWSYLCNLLPSPNSVHDCFASLVACLDRFLLSLSSLPESTIEIIKSSVKSFHTDLKYWESCLKEHKGQSLNCIELVMPTLPVQNNIASRTFGYT